MSWLTRQSACSKTRRSWSGGGGTPRRRRPSARAARTCRAARSRRTRRRASHASPQASGPAPRRCRDRAGARPGPSTGAAGVEQEQGRRLGRAGAPPVEDRSRGAARAERGRRRGPSRGAADRGSPPTTAVRENYSCEAAAGARVPAWYLC
jgi:hypothetical protein